MTLSGRLEERRVNGAKEPEKELFFARVVR